MTVETIKIICDKIQNEIEKLEEGWATPNDDLDHAKCEGLRLALNIIADNYYYKEPK